MAASSSSTYPNIIWRSRWDSAMASTAPRRPAAEEVLPIVHQVVDQIFEGPGVNKTRVGTILRKGATTLAPHYVGLIPANWLEIVGGADSAEQVQNEVDRLFPLLYGEMFFCIDDAGVDLTDGARELAAVLTTRILKIILKLPSVEGSSILFDGFMQLLSTCAERMMSAMSNASLPPASTVVSARDTSEELEINDLPLVEGGEWGLGSASAGLVTYDTWQYRIRLACSSYGLKGRRAFYYILRNLCGSERTFAQKCYDSGVPAGEEPLDFILRRLHEEYGSVWSHGRARQQFQEARKQSNESVVAFMARLKTMASTLPGPDAVSQEELRQRFLDGIPFGLLTKLIDHYGPKVYEKRLEKVADTAEFYESRYRQSRRSNFKGGGPRFPDSKQPSRETNRSDAADRQQGKGNLSFRASGNLSGIRCYNCGGYGHLKRYCPVLSRGSGQNSPPPQGGTGGGNDDQKPKPPKPTKPPAQQAGSVEVYVGEVRGIYSLSSNDPVPKVACKIGQSAKIEANVLLDSGAASSLISEELVTLLGDDAKVRNLSVPVRLSYAGAAEEVSQKEALIPVQLVGKEEWLVLPFIIITGSDRGMLFGRTAMCSMNVTLRFIGSDAEKQQLRDVYKQIPSAIKKADDTLEEQKIQEIYVHIDEIVEEPVIRDSREDYPIEPEVTGTSSYLSWVEKTVDEILANAERPDVPTTATTEEIFECYIDAALETISKAGWIELGEYRGRLVESGPVDNAVQRFQFEIGWDVTIDEERQQLPWDSTRLISKLTPTQLSEWEKEISQYVEKGWWEPISREEVIECGLTTMAGSAFPVLQPEKSTRVRPCLDLRRCNAASPRCSSNPTSTQTSVQQLRSALSHDDDNVMIKQFDLQKAFYSIRVVPQLVDGRVLPVIVRVGQNYFQSRCLCFGLTSGPIGLCFSQLVLRKCARLASDWLQHISISGTPTLARAIVVMDDYLLVGSPSQIKHNTPILSVKRPEITKALTKPITKRKVFAVAGLCLAITGGFCESLSRSHCDVLRRISGQWSDWDTPCEDVSTCRLLEQHFDCAKYYWEACAEEDENLTLFANVSALEVRTGAAKVGYGFLVVDEKLVGGKGNIYAPNGVIYAEARGFSRKQDAWHCNRKELYGLAMCLRRLDSLLPLMPKLCTIHVGTDSKVTQKQSDPWALTSGSKALEKQAILRLRSMIIDLNFEWRQRSIKLDISYVAAGKNLHADMLSRVPETVSCIPVVKSKGEEIAPVAVEPIGETSSNSGEGIAVESSRTLASSGYGIGNDLFGWTCYVVPSYRKLIGLKQMFIAWRSATGSSNSIDKVSPICGDLRLQWLCYEQSRDSETKNAIEALRSDPSLGDKATGFTYRLLINKYGLLCRRILLKSGKGRDYVIQVVIPRHLMAEIAEIMHHQAAHAAFYEVAHKVSMVAWCPGMKKIIKRTVNACEPCQRAVMKPSDVAEGSGGIGIPTGPFKTLGIDIYGPMRLPKLSPSRADETPWYVLTFTCRLTGFTLFKLIPNCKASVVVSEIEKVVVWQLGNVTDVVITDQGSQFVCAGFASLLLMNSIRHEILPVRSPQLGGFYERHHQTLGKCLRSMLQDTRLPDWELMLCIAANRINNTATKDGAPSPFELVYGYSSKLPCARLLSVDDTATTQWDKLRPKFLPSDPLQDAQVISDSRKRLKMRDHMLGIFREFWLDRRQQAAKETGLRSKGTAPLDVGDIVLVAKERGSKLGTYVKDGKYEVISIIGKQCYRVKPVDGGAPIVAHAKNLRRFISGDEDDLLGGEDHPHPDPVISDDDNNGSKDPGSKVLDNDIPNTTATAPRKSRVDHERQFLEAIQGSQSLYGRSRRRRDVGI